MEEEKRHIDAYNKLIKSGDASYTHKSLNTSINSSFSSSVVFTEAKKVK